jgi:amino acid transporter
VSDPAQTKPQTDEQRLAELGYSQDLDRSWSAFSNFAISFSIISILAGCFTTFYQAWNNGGPVAISWGWPIISAFILVIGFCMAELVSAFPTSGGIYWWSARLGGPRAGFYTGWLNLIGLLGIQASVTYGCATFASVTLNLFLPDAWQGTLHQVFALFCALMVVVTLLNIFSSSALAMVNNISAYWHVVGAAIVVAILIFAPARHQTLDFVFTHTVNNSGYSNGMFWFLVLPLGFLLTQYTITGYDASAHLSEETQGAATTAARGLWQSIFYSAVGGYVLLLAFVFAATDTDVINSADPSVNPYGVGSVFSIFATSVGVAAFKAILVISTVGQFFCAIACMTSCSRMLYAFSRDGAVPGSRLWTKLNAKRVPSNAVLLSGAVAVLITLPAYKEFDVGGYAVPVAFLAVVSVGVLGLYLAFAIPIYLRWKAGDDFQTGPWNLGRKYRWMAPLAVAEIVVISVYFILPFTPGAIPWHQDFSWTLVNYAPIVTGGALLAITIWWYASARHWFTGPRRTVDDPVLGTTTTAPATDPA